MELHSLTSRVVSGVVFLAAGAVGLRRWRRSRRPSRSVGEAMTQQPVCVEAHEPTQTAARRMAEEGVGALAVCRQGRPLGVVTDRDIVLRVLAQSEDPRQIAVGDCLEGEIASVGPEHTLADAAATMRSHRVRRLPVLRDGRLVGIFTQADLAQHDPLGAVAVERTLAKAGADSRSAAWLFRRPYREPREGDDG